MHSLHWTLAGATTTLSLYAAGHALLHKAQSRSALGWVGMCLFFPLAGPVLYLLFGINRVRRSASKLRQKSNAIGQPPQNQTLLEQEQGVSRRILTHPMRILAKVGRNILHQSLLGGNCVEALVNGDAAYPAMLQCIENAEESVYLTTYILSPDSAGKKFIAALERAQKRGVQVRVLIDGLGEKYSWPRASKLLQTRGIPTARFLPPHLFPPELRLNLRNHRKLLIVDGAYGFTGGMNIHSGHVLSGAPRNPISDLHLVLRGPVVSALQDCFVEDWFFATGKYLHAPVPLTEPAGDSLCRVVIEGPDQELEVLNALLTGVISAAQQSIKIMTPYFLPPHSFLVALEAAAHRGVKVQILLPEPSNVFCIDWATKHILPTLLHSGVQVFAQPAPFCHTKLLLIDDMYAHLGSANLDARSLRLNFELTLEVFDSALSRRLHTYFTNAHRRSRPVCFSELQSRSLPTRLRDAFFWLFSPYL